MNILEELERIKSNIPNMSFEELCYYVIHRNDWTRLTRTQTCQFDLEGDYLPFHFFPKSQNSSKLTFNLDEFKKAVKFANKSRPTYLLLNNIASVVVRKGKFSEIEKLLTAPKLEQARTDFSIYGDNVALPTNFMNFIKDVEGIKSMLPDLDKLFPYSVHIDNAEMCHKAFSLWASYVLSGKIVEPKGARSKKNKTVLRNEFIVELINHLASAGLSIGRNDTTTNRISAFDLISHLSMEHNSKGTLLDTPLTYDNVKKIYYSKNEK